MPSCSAYGCTSRPSKQIPGITFHRFPKNEFRKAQWISAVRRKDWGPSDRSVLCSKHFPDDAIDRSSEKVVRLKANAVPTIFDAFPVHLKKEQKQRKPPLNRTVPTSEINARNIFSVETVSKNGHDNSEQNLFAGSSSSCILSDLLIADILPDYSEQNPLDGSSSTCVLSDLSIMKDDIHDSHLNSLNESNTCAQSDLPITNETISEMHPNETAQKRKIQELEEALEREKRKVKLLQQKVRRYKNKITNLTELLEDLKSRNLMDDDAINVLNAASSINKEFISRQLKIATKNPLPKSYSPELRAFALTLHFYSPRAYNYVRDNF